VFLAAASQRTKNIRLGHGIIQITTNQPHRVAERVATLDLISGGRVELGIGEGAGPAELHPFGTRVRDKRERWEEAVQAIIPMFTRTSWEFHGKWHDFPARNVVPKPFQKPHPPLWVACSNIQTIAKAGEWGMGALGFLVRVAGGGQGLGAPLLQHAAPRLEAALRVSEEPQHRHRQRLHVRAHRRGGA
jgi:alkanesulfonate monooxygenase SsuD/methylene tetrahydromethanopterin reductase-like flavin-dependent oxidoreductase (luciferase family)